MKGGTNSVSSRIAQINKLCQPAPGAGAQLNALHEVLLKHKQYLYDYFYLFMIMYRTGCRISEALNIKVSDCNADGRLLINGLKGSGVRICFVPELADYWYRVRKGQELLFPYMNRYSAYRHLQSIGIGKVKKGRKNASVTHIFRDNYVKMDRGLTDNKRVLSDSIGHKNLKSTEFYGKD